MSVLKKIFFYLFLVFIVLAPTIVAVMTESIAYGFLLMVSILMAVILFRFDSVIEISIGPLKAKLQQVIAEANATLEQLKSVAMASSRVALREVVMSQFPTVSTQFSNSYELREEIIGAMKSVGADASEIEHIEQEWRKGVGFIVHREVCHLLKPQLGWGVSIRISEPTDDEKKASVMINALGDIKLGHLPTLGEIRQELAKYEVSSDALDPINEILDDYESFLRTGILKHPARFDKQSAANGVSH